MKKKWRLKVFGPMLGIATVFGLAGLASAAVGTVESGHQGIDGPFYRAPEQEGDAPARRQPAAPKQPAVKQERVDYGWQRSWIAYPTGNRSNSVLLVEKVCPATVVAGKPFECEIKVTNLTGMSLDSVTVNENIPASFQNPQATPEFERAADGRAQWKFSPLGPHESRTIRLSGVVNDQGSVPCCTTAQYSQPGLCLTTQVVQPMLKLAASVGTAQATPCDLIPVQLVVTNTGSGTAQNVQLTSQLPEGLMTADGRDSVAFSAGNLSTGESESFTVNVKAARTGTYSVSATAAAENGLTAQGSSENVSVQQAALAVSTEGPSKALFGRPATYSSTVNNTGDAPAANAVVEQSIPSGARVASVSEGGRVAGGKIVWNLGTLQPNRSTRVSATMALAAAGLAQTRATATANCCSDATSSAQTEISGIPAILLEMVDINDPIEVGNEESYVIRVTNQGSAPDTNVRVTATFPDSEDYVTSSGQTAGSLRGNVVTFAPVGTLSPKAVATWKVIVKGNRADQAIIKVSLSSDQLHQSVEKTEATTIY